MCYNCGWTWVASWAMFQNKDHLDGFVQERRNSSALAMELRLSCTNPSIFIFAGIGILIIKTRWSWDWLAFIMGIFTPVEIVVRPSYLCNENSYTGKMASLYGNGPLIFELQIWVTIFVIGNIISIFLMEMDCKITSCCACTGISIKQPCESSTDPGEGEPGVWAAWVFCEQLYRWLHAKET